MLKIGGVKYQYFKIGLGINIMKLLGKGFIGYNLF